MRARGSARRYNLRGPRRGHSPPDARRCPGHGNHQRGNSGSLRRQGKSIPNLIQYWRSVAKIFDMNLAIFDLDEARFRRAQVMQQRHGLLTNDSLILAAADSYGIAALATRDEDFDDVPWLTVYKPGTFHEQTPGGHHGMKW